MRLFFALEPAKTAIGVLSGVQNDLQRLVRHEAVKWVPESRWHVTVHFLGEVSSAAGERLMDAMGLLLLAPLEFTMWSLDVFPSWDEPRAIVLRLADMRTDAFRLHQDLIPIILREDLHVSPHPWQPHITLAGVRPGRSGFFADVSHIHVPQYTFPLSRLTLFESVLGKGIQHVPIASIDLPRSYA
ncbi:MAG: RNA 2',3'-cyclic phosphodiesterase [Patescibacteria group bacterium]